MMQCLQMKSRRHHRRLRLRHCRLRAVMRRRHRRCRDRKRTHLSDNRTPWAICRKYQCPGAARFANMIGRRRNKGRTKSSNDVVSLEKNNDAHFVRNFFIAAMIAVVVCSPPVVIAAPVMIGHAFGTIVAINAFGTKSLTGAMIVFALIQSAVASHVEDDDAAHEANVSGPVEENDPDAVHEVDRIAAAVLLAWLVTTVVIVALTGASADFGRPNHATGDGAAAASSVDMELGHQGNASCTSNSAAPKFNCKNCNFENPCERTNFEIQGTSETVCVSCPDCKQMLWHCCGCGRQWWKTKEEVIKKRGAPKRWP